MTRASVAAANTAPPPEFPWVARTRYGLAPSTSLPTGYAIDGCKHCGGVWVDPATLEKIFQEAAPQVSLFPVDERSVPRRLVSGVTAPLAYRRCPACQELMTRRNFQRVSGVMLDACRDHGTFFDMGELHDVLNFVRRGGLVLAQQKRATQERAFSMDDVRINETLKHRKQERAPTQIDGDASHALYEAPPHGDTMMSLGELTLSLLRWGTGWTKRLRAQLAGRRTPARLAARVSTRPEALPRPHLRPHLSSSITHRPGSSPTSVPHHIRV